MLSVVTLNVIMLSVVRCHHACPYQGYRGKPDLFLASAARPIVASALAGCRQVAVPGSSNCKKAGRSVRFLHKINVRMKTFGLRESFQIFEFVSEEEAK
jgi:hypothetical protein